MLMETDEVEVMESVDGEHWTKATPLPYYPSLVERLLHFLGFHIWTCAGKKECVMCGKPGD